MASRWAIDQMKKDDLIGAQSMFRGVEEGGIQAKPPRPIGQPKPLSNVPMINPQNLMGNQAMIQASLPLSPQQRAGLRQIRRPQDMLFGQPVFGRS